MNQEVQNDALSLATELERLASLMEREGRSPRALRMAKKLMKKCKSIDRKIVIGAAARQIAKTN